MLTIGKPKRLIKLPIILIWSVGDRFSIRFNQKPVICKILDVSNPLYVVVELDRHVIHLSWKTLKSAKYVKPI
jgi:hypothetical protein